MKNCSKVLFSNNKKMVFENLKTISISQIINLFLGCRAVMECNKSRLLVLQKFYHRFLAGS